MKQQIIDRFPGTGRAWADTAGKEITEYYVSNPASRTARPYPLPAAACRVAAGRQGMIKLQSVYDKAEEGQQHNKIHTDHEF